MNHKEKADWESFKKTELAKSPKKPKESDFEKAVKGRNDAHQEYLTGKSKEKKK